MSTNNPNTIPTTIHGLPVLAWAQTEVLDGKPAGVVLVQRGDDEWITARYKLGEREWVHGDYLFDLDEARRNFLFRVAEQWGVKPETPATVAE